MGADYSERRATMVPGQERDYYERLQSFRGFGILMVAFYHCQGVTGGELPMRPVPEHGQGTAQVLAHALALMVLNGHAALMSFFVLSGFVLTLSLRRGPQPPLSASLTFVGARLLRIIPVNAVAVLAAVAIAAIAGAAPQARVPPPWDWPRIAANMILLETTIDPVAWSLTVELLSVPFIVGMYLVARRWGPLPLLVATAATLGLSFAPRWLGFQPLGQNLFAVSMGMLVAEIGARVVGGISRRRATAWFAFASVLWFVTRALLGRWSHWASVAEACAAAIMIALIVSGPALAPYRAFELRPILWLGEISFSLYVYHALLWPWVAPSAGAPVFVRLGGWGPLAAVFATWVVTIAVTIPAAWLSYVIVERAGIGAGRMLRRRMRAAVAPLGARGAPST